MVLRILLLEMHQRRSLMAVFRILLLVMHQKRSLMMLCTHAQGSAVSSFCSDVHHQACSCRYLGLPEAAAVPLRFSVAFCAQQPCFAKINLAS